MHRAVRLIDTRGRVVYSSVEGESGGRLATTPAFKAALKGTLGGRAPASRGEDLGGRLRAATPL